jgi:sigma-E factor negative regulatory protein RseA
METTMSTEAREHLSSLMDGELSRDTGRFLVRRLGADEELCATWARYHLVRDCLRHPEGGLASVELSGRVRRAIAREALPLAPGRRIAGWLKPAAGLAVAASVALVAIVAVGPSRQAPDQPVVAGGEVAALESFTSPQGLTAVPVSRQASLSGGDANDSRMNPYLLRHYQATGSTSGKGFVTFVPIVITSAAATEEAAEDVATAGDTPPSASASQAEGAAQAE